MTKIPDPGPPGWGTVVRGPRGDPAFGMDCLSACERAPTPWAVRAAAQRLAGDHREGWHDRAPPPHLFRKKEKTFLSTNFCCIRLSKTGSTLLTEMRG